MFILNLAGADLVVCIFSLPITPITNVYKNWYFGSTMCHGLPWMQGIAVFIGTFSLCAISVDRYIMVILPTRKIINKTVRFQFSYKFILKNCCIDHQTLNNNFDKLESCTGLWTARHSALMMIILLTIVTVISIS